MARLVFIAYRPATKNVLSPSSDRITSDNASRKPVLAPKLTDLHQKSSLLIVIDSNYDRPLIVITVAL